MKNRKILAFLLAALMLITMVPASVFAEGEEAIAEEVIAEEVTEESTKADFGVHAKAINALFRFGILDEASFDVEAKVTRADFIAKAIKLTGVSEMPAPSETVFKDVPATDPNAGAIMAAYNMGIIEGYGDGNFYPSKTLTAEQAAKILVSILGYDVHAISYGGYPSGYLVVASSQGLLKNVQIGDYEECAWGVGAQLIYNAMNCDVLQTETYPESKYFTVEGENPMTKWMGIYKIEDTFSANDTTSSTSATGVKEGSVLIGEESFIENGATTSDMIGLPVEAYYEIDETEQKVLLLVNPKKTVKTVEIDGDEVTDASASVISAYYDETIKTYPTEGSPLVIYNGKYYDGTVNKDTVSSDFGTVVLTDYNSNGKYDKIEIKKPKVVVVKTISPLTGNIKDKYGKENIVIDVNDQKVKYSVKKNGANVTLSDIKENDVLVVYESMDKKNIVIEACEDKLRGKVSEMSDEDIVIDGTVFEIVKANLSEIKKITPGNSATFYFTSDYKVAGFGDMVSGNTDYGYLLIGGIPQGGVSGAKAQLRIFNSEGVKTYETSDKLTLNGNMTSPSGKKYQGEVLLNALAESSYCFQLYENAGFASQPTPDPGASTKNFYCNQVIRFNTDDSGVITEIETAIDNRAETGGTGGYYEDGLSLDYTSYAAELDPSAAISYGTITYSGNESNIISSRYVIPDSNTWKIPNFDTWKAFYNGEIDLESMTKFCSTFAPRSSWVANTSYSNIEVYDSNRDKMAGLVIQGVAGASEAVADLDFFLVDKMVNTLDDEGYATRKLYGCYAGKYEGYEIDFESSQLSARPELATTLKQGDIIRIARDSMGKITFIRRVFTMADYDGNKNHIYRSFKDKAEAVEYFSYLDFPIATNPDNNNDKADHTPEFKTYMKNYSEWMLHGNVFDDWVLESENKTPWGGGYTAYYHRTGVPQTLWYNHPTSFSWNKLCNSIHGKVVGKNGDILTIDLGTAEDGTKLPEKLIAAHYKYAKYYVYDEANEKVYVGTLNDIDPDDPYQTIVLRNRYQAFWEAVIIKHAQPVGDVTFVGGYKN